MSNQPAFDYYDVPPPWWETQSKWLWAVVVGVATAVLTVISFPNANLPEFAYVFASPAVFWAYSKPSFRLFAGTILTAQVAAWCYLLSWLSNVTVTGSILLGAYTGIFIGLWYLAVWWIAPQLPGRRAYARIAGVVLLGSLWVLLEYARTHFLGGFAWLPLAATQWQRTSILQISSITGAWGVSFVLILFNVGFAAYGWRLFNEAKSGLRRRSPEFLFVLSILLVSTIPPLVETMNRVKHNTRMGTFAFVQPNIPQNVKWDASKSEAIISVLEKSMNAAAANEPQLVLWPEATVPWAVYGDEQTKAWIEGLVKQANCPLLLGSIGIENPKTPQETWVNGVFSVSPNFGLLKSYYAKRHLVPFGEYVPLRPVFGWLKKFVPIGDDFTPGTSSIPIPVQFGSRVIDVGPLVCYEDIFPELARESVNSGAELIFVATNDAWYGEGAAAYQHAAHSVLRAVETRRPVLRCGNAGWSGWIDEFGSIRSEMKNSEGSIYFRGVKTITVSRDSRWLKEKSFYVRHGDWFVVACAILALLGYYLLRTSPAAEVPPAEELQPL